MEETKIYVLIDPEYLKIRYIGITKKSLKERLSGHIADSLLMRDNSRKGNWIKSLNNRNLIPIIRLIKICKTRKEALLLEDKLINKYYVKYNLVNDLNSGKFNNKSARKLLRKPLYIYNYNGSFIKECSTIKEAAKEFNLYYGTINKILSGSAISTKGYQFSRDKLDNMPDLNKYSPKNHKLITLKDTITDDILEFTSMVHCCNVLNIKKAGSSIKDLKGSLNLNFGNRYLLLENDKWTQSTYYNTGVVVTFLDGTIKKFKYLRDLATFLGIKPKTGFYKNQLINKLKKIGIKNVEFNKPISEVI